VAAADPMPEYQPLPLREAEAAAVGADDGMEVGPEQPRIASMYTDPSAKPPVPYPTLVYDAIHSLNKDKATIGEIYMTIMEQYPYYAARATETGWKNSVRHNLTLHKCFVKVAREQGESGKGGYWRVDEQLAISVIDTSPRPYAPPRGPRGSASQRGRFKGFRPGGTGSSAEQANTTSTGGFAPLLALADVPTILLENAGEIDDGGGKDGTGVHHSDVPIDCGGNPVGSGFSADLSCSVDLAHASWSNLLSSQTLLASSFSGSFSGFLGQSLSV